MLWYLLSKMPYWHIMLENDLYTFAYRTNIYCSVDFNVDISYYVCIFLSIFDIVLCYVCIHTTCHTCTNIDIWYNTCQLAVLNMFKHILVQRWLVDKRIFQGLETTHQMASCSCSTTGTGETPGQSRLGDRGGRDGDREWMCWWIDGSLMMGNGKLMMSTVIVMMVMVSDG